MAGIDECLVRWFLGSYHFYVKIHVIYVYICTLILLALLIHTLRRRALHKFDPPDLHLRQPAQTTITLAPRPCVTAEDKQQEEIAQAKASGLQVAFGSMAVGKEAAMFSINVAADEETGTMTMNGNGGVYDMANGVGVGGKSEEVPFDEEAAYQQNKKEEFGIGLEEECESDSDDDLL